MIIHIYTFVSTHTFKNLNFYFPVTALDSIVFSMFLFIVFVILSLFVTILFFCYVSGADRGAGSKIYNKMHTIFTKLLIILCLLWFLFDVFVFVFIFVLHFLML